MRGIFGSNAAVIGRDFATHAYLTIDDVPCQDVLGYNPLMGATWDHDLDSPVGSGQIRVDLGGRAGITSPWHSRTALLDGRPLFDVGRYLSVWTATTERAVTPQPVDWRRVFDSRIDDYDPAASGDDDIMVLNSRDRLSDVLDTWIEDKLIDFGGANVEVVLFAFLDAAFGPAPPISFVVDPSPAPSFFVSTATYDPQSCLILMRNIALLTGWDLRGGFARGGLAPNEWGLVFQDVGRGQTIPDWTFSASRYERPTRMAVSRNTVRNRIRVIPNTPERDPIVVFDSDSINKYGPRFAEIDEGKTSHIDTVDEGTDLANFALADLKDPKSDWVVPMPYWYPTEMHDRYEFQPASDGIHFDQTTALSVSGYRHTLEGGEAKTELRLRRSAAAANRDWRTSKPLDRYVREFDPTGTAHEGALWIRPAP